MTSPSACNSRSRLKTLWHLLRDLGDLLRGWWQVDRIRVSPQEGELLRLPVHTLLQLEGVWWTVQTRWVCDSAHGPAVRYQCEHEEETATLEVQQLPPVGTGTIRWTIDSVSRELHPAEIEVYEMTC